MDTGPRRAGRGGGGRGSLARGRRVVVMGGGVVVLVAAQEAGKVKTSAGDALSEALALLARWGKRKRRKKKEKNRPKKKERRVKRTSSRLDAYHMSSSGVSRTSRAHSRRRQLSQLSPGGRTRLRFGDAAPGEEEAAAATPRPTLRRR